MASGNEINFFINYIQPKPNANWQQKWIDRWEKRRSFFSCNGEYNYLNYMETGSPTLEKEYFEAIDGEEQPKDNEKRGSYLDYMEQDIKSKKLASLGKEKSKGLFDKDGLCSKERRNEHDKSLKETKGIIWEGIITFEKDYGNKYCSTTEQAQSAMKVVFKNFLNQTHLKDKNITWTGALHENTDHYHIHYTFYETKPWREVDWSKDPVYTSKGNIDKKAFDYIKQSFYKYFEEQAIDVHTLREKSTARFKEFRSDFSRNGNYFKDFKQLGKTLAITTDKPKYEALSDKQRLMVDRFSMRILRTQPDLVAEYNKTFAELGRAKSNMNLFAKARKIEPIESKAESFKRDFLKRLGNSVLGSCVNVYTARIKANEKVDELKRRKKDNDKVRFRQANIRRIKKGFSKFSYNAFQNMLGERVGESVIKDYKWLEIVEESERQASEKQESIKKNVEV